MSTSEYDRFIESNIEQFSICANIQLMLIFEIDMDCGMAFKTQVLRHGYFSELDDLCEIADKLCIGELPVNHYATRLCESATSEDEVDAWQDVFQALTFGKRFSPLFATKIENDSVIKFFDNQKRILDHHTDGQSSDPGRYPIVRDSYFLPLIKEEFQELLNFAWLIFDEEYDTDFCNIPVELTSGANADCASTLRSKLNRLADTTHNILGGIPLIGSNVQHYTRVAGPKTIESVPYLALQKTASVLKAVPKSSKAARLIAMETVKNQVYAKRIDRIWRKAISMHHISLHIDLTDQSYNRMLAGIGSSTGEYATIDLSSASDSIYRGLIYALCDDSYDIDFLTAWLPKYVFYKDRYYRVYCAATSGNAQTFALETSLFAICCDVAVSLQEFFEDLPEAYKKVGHRVRARKKKADSSALLPNYFVYGDDIVIKTKYYATLVDILESLGFVVNKSKSFTTPSVFRESCGGNFIKGVDITARLWPRKVLSFKDQEAISKSLCSLVSLQHALYGHTPVRVYLDKIIKSYEPRMTSSRIGSTRPDLWGLVDEGPTIRAPYDVSDWPTFCEGVNNAMLEAGYTKEDVWHTLYRVKHLVPSTRVELSERSLKRLSRHPEKADYSLFVAAANEDAYKYYRFLVSGPYYESPLDELLGISAERPSLPVYDPHDRVTGWKYTID
jgi:hypothetical protein